MDEFLPAVAMTLLIKKVIDFGAFVTNHRWRAAATQAIVWIAGVVVVCLYAQTDWADTFGFAGLMLSQMNFASQVALGLGLASTASVATDTLKSLDNTDSASVPSLIPPPTP